MQKDDSFRWSSPPTDLALKPHQVDVWRIPLDLSVDSVKSLGSSLSADESERAARFYFPADRHHYIVAHAALHDIIARYLCREPHRLSFSKGEYGKPTLVAGDGIEFNLSHSGEYALIALTCGRQVGVDVERFREDLQLDRMARRYFSEREISELVALPPDQRTLAFFNCWTRKEAYIKARGLGLSLALDSFDVSLAPGEPAMLRATRPDQQEATHWTLQTIEVDIGYAGALAIEGQNLEYRYWDWIIR